MKSQSLMCFSAALSILMASVASAQAERKIASLPFKPGWYAMGVGSAKCSKNEDIRDYIELSNDASAWSMFGPGEIKIAKVAQTGPGRYRATEVSSDENGKKHPHVAHYKQLTPTSFTRSVKNSAVWPDGTMTFQHCTPKDTPPDDR